VDLEKGNSREAVELLFLRKATARRFARKRTVVHVVLSSIALLVAACGLNDVGGGSGPGPLGLSFRETYAWPVSTPAKQGMDSAQVLAGLQQIRNNAYLTSVLVIKNDFLVFEYYAPGIVKDNDFNIQSVSGSFASALVGIAIERGLVRSVNEPILKFFPLFDTTRMDPRKRAWTLEHLLTMRSGMEWNESDDHSVLFNSATNWLNTALGLPLKTVPGDTFVFATPNANILSALLTRVSGTTTYRFAEQVLFEPLKISVRSWSTDPQDLYLGGTGMRFTPRDLARFGQLYLHQGYIDGKQIVPPSWIQQSLVPRNRYNSVKGDLAALNFGYLWWTNYAGVDSLFAALGYGGQVILVVPARSMIIVTVADDAVSREQAEENELAIIAIVRKYFF